MKHVLCLSTLIEDTSCAKSTQSPQVDIEHSRKELASLSDPFKGGVPQKNTFIHFTIPRSPDVRPATPTTSAPGILLKRLFKTTTDGGGSGVNDEIPDLPLSSRPSESV